MGHKANQLLKLIVLAPNLHLETVGAIMLRLVQDRRHQPVEHSADVCQVRMFSPVLHVLELHIEQSHLVPKEQVFFDQVLVANVQYSMGTYLHSVEVYQEPRVPVDVLRLPNNTCLWSIFIRLQNVKS